MDCRRYSPAYSAVYLAGYTLGSTLVYIPIADIYVDFGIWYIPFVVFVMLAMTNAVNLTDGLDGLASGVTAFVSLFFTVAGMMYGIVSGEYFTSPALSRRLSGDSLYSGIRLKYSWEIRARSLSEADWLLLQ